MPYRPRCSQKFVGGVVLALIMVGLVLVLTYLYPSQSVEHLISEKCSSLREGQHLWINLKEMYANADRICFHDPYADKYFLKDIYGIHGETFEKINDGDVAIYMVAGSAIVGKIYLDGGYYLKKPVSSACKLRVDFHITKNRNTCLIEIE